MIPLCESSTTPAFYFQSCFLLLKDVLQSLLLTGDGLSLRTFNKSVPDTELIQNWIMFGSNYLAVCLPGWQNRVHLGCGRCSRLPFDQKLPVGDSVGAALPLLCVSGPQWSTSPQCWSCTRNYGNTEERAKCFFCVKWVVTQMWV